MRRTSLSPKPATRPLKAKASLNLPNGKNIVPGYN
jgi:hypothetical protein